MPRGECRTLDWGVETNHDALEKLEKIENRENNRLYMYQRRTNGASGMLIPSSIIDDGDAKMARTWWLDFLR